MPYEIGVAHHVYGLILGPGHGLVAYGADLLLLIQLLAR